MRSARTLQSKPNYSDSPFLLALSASLSGIKDKMKTDLRWNQSKSKSCVRYTSAVFAVENGNGGEQQLNTG